MENPNKKLEDSVILERLLKEMRYSANEFSKEIGVTPSALYHVINSANRLSTDLANRIILRFPEVNYLFLTLGQEPIMGHKNTAQIQKNILGSDNQKIASFDSVPGTLKNIEALLQKIYDKME